MQGDDQGNGEHGAHTLRIVTGEVIGRSGDDVFVELGPRMQGVISVRKFEEEPEVGQQFQFKLHGQEESLWVLSLASTATLACWRDIEAGSLVEARAIRSKPGGLELKVGPLHAFMPMSQTGLPRGERLDILVGRHFLCEVLEVDPERQRVFLSRKRVLQRERDDGHQREIGHLKPGQVIQGRVVRIEAYGVFLRFGRGLEGLVHVSNLAHDRVEHPQDLVKMGETIRARILTITRQGRRIALGVKQLDGDPWESVEKRFYRGQIVEGYVLKIQEFGLFVRIARGVEGLLPRSQADVPEDRSLREQYRIAQRLAVRIHYLDPEEQRLTLSRIHRDGSTILDEEAIDRSELDEFEPKRGSEGSLRSSLESVLRKALDAPTSCDD